MSAKKSWFVEQIHEARRELDGLPNWVKDAARFAGGETGTNVRGASPRLREQENKPDVRVAGKKRA